MRFSFESHPKQELLQRARNGFEPRLGDHNVGALCTDQLRIDPRRTEPTKRPGDIVLVDDEKLFLANRVALVLNTTTSVDEIAVDYVLLDQPFTSPKRIQ